MESSTAPDARETWRQAAWLIGLVALCLGAAGVGAAWTSPSVGDWYQTLKKPAWTPPDWVFGPVWTVLYVMMAVAAWLVWRQDGWPVAWPALAVFAVQLALNVAWSGLFFGLRRPGYAFAEIIVLWLAIGATTIVFWRRTRLAGVLFVPYWAWVSFAAVLNLTIWRMNA